MQVRLLRIARETSCPGWRDKATTSMFEPSLQLIVNLSINAEGTFRQDLYYRLKVVTLELPSLRERPKDILTLGRFFIRRFSDRYEKPIPRLSTAAARALLTYPWPGNIRELEHAIEQAIILMEGDTLHPQNFGLGEQIHSGLVLEFPDDIDSFASIRQEVEDRLDRELVTRALARQMATAQRPLNS